MDLSNYTDTELLELIHEYNIRRTGRSTRLIDKYIQLLFIWNNEWVEIKDHDDLPVEIDCRHKMSRQLADRVIKRLMFEHNVKPEVDRFGEYVKIKVNRKPNEYINKIREEYANRKNQKENK